MDLVKELIQLGTLHCFIWNQEGYLFDSTSNSVFSCSVQDILDIKEEHPSLETIQDIQELYDHGYFQEKPVHFEDNRIYKSLCLIMTRNCNFRCPYCFEKGKSNFSEQVMEPQVVQKAFEFLVQQSGNRRVLECDFFGGEPLLAWESIQYAIALSKKIELETGKRFRFSLTTNASLLTPEMTDYLYRHDISLILSQDGTPENHNRFRISSQGKPTYEEVMGAILPISQTWKEGYYVRGTYTKKNIHFLQDVQHLYAQGIQKISFEPVVSEQKDIGFCTTDLPVLKDEYQKLSTWVLDTLSKDPDFSFYHFEVNLTHGACKEKLMTSCGAGVEYLSVSPEGDLYPCHQFDANADFKIGTVFDGITNTSIVETCKKCTYLASKAPCVKCWARYICGGGCSANNLRMTGQLLTPWDIGCEIQKMRIEAALYVQVKRNAMTKIKK
ncbi:MAG: SPASM domain-containing protein [Caldisericia bacterium]|nr:SPASM domain-containing protein [Caldisericia bacterium]MDD4613948.1 SPASM domain-containing protein [Caldisericia bacterium]